MWLSLAQCKPAVNHQRLIHAGMLEDSTKHIVLSHTISTKWNKGTTSHNVPSRRTWKWTDLLQIRVLSRTDMLPDRCPWDTDGKSEPINCFWILTHSCVSEILAEMVAYHWRILHQQAAPASTCKSNRWKTPRLLHRSFSNAKKSGNWPKRIVTRLSESFDWMFSTSTLKEAASHE